MSVILKICLNAHISFKTFELAEIEWHNVLEILTNAEMLQSQTITKPKQTKISIFPYKDFSEFLQNRHV